MSFDPTTLNIIKAEVNTMVSAGPGAGKTELLAQKASYLLQTNKLVFPRQILALSYKVDAAKNLSRRVTDRCGDTFSRRFVSKTYDAFAKNILDQFSNLLPDDLRPKNDYQIATDSDITAAYAAAGYQKVMQKKRNFYLKTYLVQYKLPFAETEYGDIARKVWPLLVQGNEQLGPKLTYPMIARLAEYIVRTFPSVRNSLRLTYGHIFLDEFQDTPQHHYDLIKSTFSSPQNVLTAVGDSKQRVMIWAGAVSNIFDQFTADFNSNTETMLFNHRSAPRLIMLQQPMIKKMTNQNIDIKYNEKWTGSEGVSELWSFRNDVEESIVAAKKINELINEHKLEASEICILTRKLPKEYTSKISDELNRYNIESRIEEIYQRLLKEDLIQIFQAFFHLVSPVKSPDEWTFLIRILKHLFGFNSRTSTSLLIDLETQLTNFISLLKKNIECVTSKEELDQAVNLVVDFLDPAKLIAVYNNYDQRYLENLKNEFVNLLWQEYCICNDWLLSIQSFKGSHSIPIMSIHKSKGLEYKAVFLIGLEDSAFFGSNMDEELCTFFVAVSRAIEHLYITRCVKRNDEGNTVSKVKPFFDLWCESGVGQHITFKNFEDASKNYFNKDSSSTISK
ncbi:ATP-dependent helicase [Paenibacillus sp. IITD108]|uniref:ATP-dependent helicase n=1 Tax=Paenibacillus sp. IITD108 TaxID=3116649 RepID=UPI002F42ADB7